MPRAEKSTTIVLPPPCVALLEGPCAEVCLCCLCCFVLCLLQFCCVVAVFAHDSHEVVNVRMRKRASIFCVVLRVGLLDFRDILAIYSFHGEVSMRGGHGREGSGCDDDTSALAGRLKERRSSAVTAEGAVAATKCCANSHRSFRLGSPNTTAPIHSCSFEYLLTPRQRANRTCVKNKCTRKLLRMAGHLSVSVFSKKIWKYLIIKRKWRTPPGGTLTFDQITDGHYPVLILRA